MCWKEFFGRIFIALLCIHIHIFAILTHAHSSFNVRERSPVVLFPNSVVPFLQAKSKLIELYAFIESTTKQLLVKVDDMAALQKCMEVLRDFRAEESHIDMIITPILDMYEVGDNRCSLQF